MAFAYVIYIMQILYIKYGDIAVVIYIVRQKRLNVAFIYGAQRFSPSVNEYARNILKIWWDIDVEDFGVRKAYVQCQKLGLVINT